MKHLKQEFDKLTFKEAIVFSMAYASIIAGFVLVFIGFITDPKGQIHESVQIVFGMILIFVGALLGISIHFDNELIKFKQSIPEIIRSIAENIAEGSTAEGKKEINIGKKEGGEIDG